MTLPASYVVIKYLADPGRNEPLNVGVLAWSDRGYEIEINREAVARVIRENPRLHPDSLLYLDEALRDRFGLDDRWNASALVEGIALQKGYPVVLSEVRETTVASEEAGSLRATVERLVDRVVRPKRRSGFRADDPFSVLQRRLAPLIRGQEIYPRHVFAKTLTGVPRSVDFFVNSGRNAALDTVRLDLKRGWDIILRADAEANKIADIRSRNEDLNLFVFLKVSDEPEVRETIRDARQILKTADVRVIDDLDEAATFLEESASTRAR